LRQRVAIDLRDQVADWRCGIGDVFDAARRDLERSRAARSSHLDDARMTGVNAAPPRVSFADIAGWPEDGRRYELYDGEVYVVPSPLLLHQIVSARLHLALEEYTRTYGGVVLYAPLDIVLTEFDVVQPDLLLFTRDRQHLLHPRVVTRHPPDLAIEILSPSTAGNDRGRKMQLLARHQVREYWLVDPQAVTIEVYRLAGDRFELAGTAAGADRVQSPLLQELALVPRELVPPDDHLQP
jgi:Uma2 family endonuclease